MKIKKNSNRSFGIVFFIFFLIIATWPLLNDKSIRLWSLVLSIIFFILGMLDSKILHPLNTTWFKLGLLLGKLISPIVMGVIFFLVVTPIGLLMRIFKKDLLNLSKSSKNSYWIDKTGPKSKMRNQF